MRPIESEVRVKILLFLTLILSTSLGFANHHYYSRDTYYCSGYYSLINAQTNQSQSTYPTLCSDAVRTFREGFYCKGIYSMVNAKTSEVQSTHPMECISAMTTFYRGFYCKGYYSLVNARTGKVQSTHPAYCVDTIGSMVGY